MNVIKQTKQNVWINPLLSKNRYSLGKKQKPLHKGQNV